MPKQRAFLFQAFAAALFRAFAATLFQSTVTSNVRVTDRPSASVATTTDGDHRAGARSAKACCVIDPARTVAMSTILVYPKD